jgi:hypothetical protein
LKVDPKAKAQRSAEMRKFSADMALAIENNGAVTLPSSQDSPADDEQKRAHKAAWFVGAAIVGSAMLWRRVRS